METTVNKTPEPPVQILVQTLTYLVPGNGSSERYLFMLNGICQTAISMLRNSDGPRVMIDLPWKTNVASS
ncbi:hypothetical protein TOPH_07717 [Tolypocladium ophioglossoides CBS 100239]|uniref:Uncharacterized protein n=1 Tax=Tolypocladium ophioglossoides (strain CBS 100239) TaxID=1163406 RepID=A0A0L0N0H4_TOLOC|nr:hypothetical protein TOPH_07717 [Tolypocladium ophioglossoides CBS 100239]